MSYKLENQRAPGKLSETDQRKGIGKNRGEEKVFPGGLETPRSRNVQKEIVELYGAQENRRTQVK